MNRSGSLVNLRRLLCFLLVLAVAPSAAAQRAPQPPSPEILQASTPYNNADAVAIREYGTYWANQLTASNTTDAVEEARQKLGGILTGPLAPSALFRGELSKSVVPALGSALVADDLHKAINAINVLSDLRTSLASRSLQQNIDAGAQPVDQIRIRAAKGLESTLDFASRFPALTDIRPRDITAMVRTIENAAGDEANPLVQRYLFEAIAAAHAGDALDDASKESIRNSLISALEAVLANAGNPKPTAGSLEAVYVGTNRLYAIYLQLNVNAAAQRTLGPKVASVIRLLVESASHSWEDSRADARLKRTFAQTLQLCEQFMRPIDVSVRAGQTLPDLRLQELWLADDQTAFDTAANQLIDILSNPPYDG